MKADYFLEDQQEVELAGISWKVLFTPGHTQGSVCYLANGEDVVFSGDTLFLESLGRTDFPTSSTAKIVRSITEKLRTTGWFTPDTETRRPLDMKSSAIRWRVTIKDKEGSHDRNFIK